MANETIKAKVDEYVKWNKFFSECKREIERLKGDFQKLGIESMKDKKIKQSEFYGSEGAKVVVTQSESLKVQYHTFLAQNLGEAALKDFVKEEVNYKYSKPFERLLIAIFNGAYVEQTLDDVIGQIADDPKTKKTLKKKLKGKWDKDVATLEAIAGLDREEAEYYAFFAQEALNYERVVQLMKAAGYSPGTEEFEEALKAVKTAVIVDEGVKVGVEYEEE